MTPERYQRLMALFDEACGHRRSVRTFVDEGVRIIHEARAYLGPAPRFTRYRGSRRNRNIYRISVPCTKGSDHGHQAAGFPDYVFFRITFGDWNLGAAVRSFFS